MSFRRNLLAAIFLAVNLLEAQDTARSVDVTGDVRQRLTLTAAELRKMPRASVKTKSDSVEITYEGVWLHEVLKLAGVPELRGKGLASYLLAEARDGYQVVYSLAELDPAFTESQVLLTDTADGKPLSGAQGPFRLVAPKDKRGARSMRMVTRLTVVQVGK